MCRIVRGSTSILPNGRLMSFIKLTSPEDIEAARGLQGKSSYLLFNIIKKDYATFAGPYIPDSEELEKAQKIINARSNQIEKYKSREEKVPNIGVFLRSFRTSL